MFYKFAGAARTKVGTELKLVDENRFEFVWIVDFPMYERNEEEKQVDFSHNPFSMPQGELEALRDHRIRSTILAYQYDIVCNGYELCSGAIRNHLPEIMLKAFEIAGYGAGSGRGAVRRHATAPSATARRRTAAWRRASTASSCCWPARRTSARSSPSR